MKSKYLALAICLLLIIACENRNSVTSKKNESPQILSEYLGKEIFRDFTGIVLDENESPIRDAIITIGHKTAITDFTGYFEIKNANTNTNFAFIEAKKEGYKRTLIDIVPNYKNEVKLILNKENEPSLFWFSKHNHSLPNSND